MKPSHIVEILGVDVSEGEKIYKETKKVSNKINSNILIS
jgi:hypothetical protein